MLDCPRVGHFEDVNIWDPGAGRYELTHHGLVRKWGVFQIVGIVVASMFLLRQIPFPVGHLALGLSCLMGAGFLLFRKELRADPILKRVELLWGVGPWLKLKTIHFADVERIELDAYKYEGAVNYSVQLMANPESVRVGSYTKQKEAEDFACRLGTLLQRPVERSGAFLSLAKV